MKRRMKKILGMKRENLETSWQSKKRKRMTRGVHDDGDGYRCPLG